MVKVAVFASGNGGNFQSIVEESKKDRLSNYEIKLLIVDKPSAYALERAKNLDIPTHTVILKDYSSKEEYENKIMEILEENEIELIALAGYMKIISKNLLGAYKDRIINIHPAYLPNFPGKDGIGDAYRTKALSTGVTIHYVDEGIDTGKIIYQEKLEINKEWNLEKLAEEIHKIEHRIYPVVLNKLCKNK